MPLRLSYRQAQMQSDVLPRVCQTAVCPMVATHEQEKTRVYRDNCPNFQRWWVGAIGFEPNGPHEICSPNLTRETPVITE